MIHKYTSCFLVAILTMASPIQADTPEDQLFKSIISKDAELLKNLIADGVNVNADNGRGHTALSFAFVLKNKEMLQELVNAGAEIDAEKLAEKGGCHVCHSSANGPGVALANAFAPHLAAQHEEYLLKHTNIQ